MCHIRSTAVCGRSVGISDKGIRRQGYEAPKVDSLKPRKYSHLVLVDLKLTRFIICAGAAPGRKHAQVMNLSGKHPLNFFQNRPYTAVERT